MKRFVAILLACLVVSGAALAQQSDEETFYTPLLISFVPMVSMPIGYFDVSLSAAAVGALVRNSYGLMGAGVFNISRESRGLMAAGVFNTTGDLKGLQAAGVFNTARDVNGFQAAGVFNAADKVNGAQVAGVFNTAGDFHGFQAAPIFNTARDFRGLQLAYGSNFAEDLTGAQIAYAFNRALRVKGVQIGLVNVATEMDGVQIGLVNIARDGVNGLGATLDPATKRLDAYWQNGTRAFYTVLNAEMPVEDLFNSYDNIIAGAGIGTRFGGRHFSPYIDLEVLAMGAFKPTWDAIESKGLKLDSDIGEYFLPWPELRIRLGIPLSRFVQLVGGYTLDFDFASASFLPGIYKTGTSWSDTLFGESFTAYGHWFLGLKI